MKDFANNPHATALDQRIDKLLEQLGGLTGESEDYSKTLTNLVKLMDARDKIIKTSNETSKIEADARRIDNEFDANQERIVLEKMRLDNDILLETRRTSIEDSKLRLEEERFAADQEKSRSWRPSPDAVVGAAVSIVTILSILHYEKLNNISSKALGFVRMMK